MGAARRITSTGSHAEPDAQAAHDLVAEEVGSGAPQRLLTASVECFYERGFYATTTRDIASRAGMSPAAMYIHYSSKTDLLFLLTRLGHRDALRTMVEQDTGEADPRARLWNVVAAFAAWHARHHRLARVSQNELHALPAEQLREIRALRLQVSERLESEIDRGIAAGAFDLSDAHETTRAILSLCIDIARWYRPTGPRSPEEMGGIYADLVLRMVSA